MFCKQCGIENAEGSAFCKNCGSNLSQPVAPQAAPAYAPPVQAAKPPLSSHPVLNAVKKTASSPLALVAIIAFSAQILFSLFDIFKNGNTIIGLLYRIIDMMGGNVPYEFYEIIDRIAYIGEAPFIFFGVVGLIPSMIVCAGLWMTFASAASRMSGGMKTAGLTMIKVIMVIQLVCCCISVAAIELLLLVCVIAAGESGVGAAIAIMVVLVVVIAASYALQIIYLAQIVKSINSAKKTVASGVPSDKVSGFVAVWTFISAAGLIFSLFTNFLSSAASMTTFICFGILIFKYKASMRALMYAPQTAETPM